MYLLITRYDQNGKILSYFDFATLQEAEAKLATLQNLPDAFITEMPTEGDFINWVVDGENQTVSVVYSQEYIEFVRNKKIAEIKQACQDYLQRYITKDEDNAVKINGVSHYFKLLKDDRFELREWLDTHKEANPKPTRSWSGTFIKDENGEYIKQERKEFPYLEIQRILAHYVARDENAFTLRDVKIDEVKALTTVEEIEAYDINSIFN